jgi:malonyl CoA-acyl carrier protein transacylase
VDWQSIINIFVGAALTVIGWFARVLWDAEKELRMDLAKLREELPQTYVTKTDYRDDIKELKEMLRHILDKLDGKVDKTI